MEKHTLLFSFNTIPFTAPKAKIRFFDFFDQGSKIITFETDIGFKSLFFSESAHSVTTKQRYFVKKTNILIAGGHGDLYEKIFF